MSAKSAMRHAALRARHQRVQEEDQRDREQEVGAAEDHRLGRAEGGDVHVVQRHRRRDERDRPRERPAPAGRSRPSRRRRRGRFIRPCPARKGAARAAPSRVHGSARSRRFPCSTSPRPCGSGTPMSTAMSLGVRPVMGLTTAAIVSTFCGHRLGHLVDHVLGQVAGGDDVRGVADDRHVLVLLRDRCPP